MSGRGFSFCGVHTDDLGLIWSELPQDIYAVSHEIDYKSETITGVPGAIPHGYDVKPRTFKMVCGFENLTEQQRSRIGSWLRAGRYGPLIMDHRPYCYYNVMVTSTVEWSDTFPMQHSRLGTWQLSGHLEFTLTAFVPNAFLLDGLTLTTAAEQGMLLTVLDGTALLPEYAQPSVVGSHAYLHNPGNAMAKLNILIEGVPGADGVQIINLTTGQQLSIAGDTESHAYYIDAVYGRVQEIVDDQMTLASHVHKGDYIELAPGCPIDRDLTYHASGSRIRIENYNARADDVGRFFYCGEWRKVIAVENGGLILDAAPNATSGAGILTQLNDVVVLRGEGAQLEISFDYMPTFY